MARKPAPVRVDKEQWSRSSKQSLSYDFPKKTYKDTPYKCSLCFADAVFTAEEQKHAFEVRKAYIWQARVLCASCWAEEQTIAKGL